VTAGHNAVAYSDNAVKLLAEAKVINLRFQLNILMSEPDANKTPDEVDKELKGARELAKMTLTMLKADALKKEAETKAIVETMTTVCQDPPM